MTAIDVVFGLFFMLVSVIPLSAMGLGRTGGIIGFIAWALCGVAFIGCVVLGIITMIGKLPV